MRDLPDVSMVALHDNDPKKPHCKIPLHIYSAADCTYSPPRVDMMLRAYKEIRAMGTEEAIETCVDLDMAIKKLPEALRWVVRRVMQGEALPANWLEICTILAKMLGWKEV